MNHEALTSAPAHPGGVIWLVGLSASGKTTLAQTLKALAPRLGLVILDGDVLRQGLCKDLGFSLEDRAENMRRACEVALLFAQYGRWSVIAMISPMRSQRLMNRTILEGVPCLEVFVDCPLEVCIERDPKGLYAKAIDGVLSDFTGISSPFEPPLEPELVIKSDERSALKGAALIADALIARGWWIQDPLNLK